MVRLNKGVYVIDNLVQRGLAKIVEQKLIPSRLIVDIRKIKQHLAKEITELSSEELTALFPAVLFLRGYDIVEEKAFVNRPYWEIRRSEPGDICHTGIGALVRSAGDLPGYQELANQYDFGIFYLTKIVLYDEDFTSSVVKTLTLNDLTTLLLAVAVNEYIDIFSLTITSIPDFRAEARDKVEQEIGISWEVISTIYKRWARIAQGGNSSSVTVS
jgi:hypothetical protein